MNYTFCLSLNSYPRTKKITELKGLYLKKKNKDKKKFRHTVKYTMTCMQIKHSYCLKDVYCTKTKKKKKKKKNHDCKLNYTLKQKIQKFSMHNFEIDVDLLCNMLLSCDNCNNKRPYCQRSMHGKKQCILT